MLKTIAVIDLFRERSGLAPDMDTLRTCFPDAPGTRLRKALEHLGARSLIIHKKFMGAYGIFAGSDFDMERATRTALENIDEIDFAALNAVADLQPILAKRHHHQTGTLRWFDVNIAPVSDIAALAAGYEPPPGTVGQFLLALPTRGETEKQALKSCREAVREQRDWDTVAGLSPHSPTIMTLVRELIAVETVGNDSDELTGDPVARREVAARVATLKNQFEEEVRKAFDSARWFRGGSSGGKSRAPKLHRHAGLNILASELADERFNQSPVIRNELLNRQKVSGPAVAARNALLRNMVLNEGRPRLGIEGFPAEGGLFASVLEATGLCSERTGWRLASPKGRDPFRLKPIWNEGIKFLRGNKNRSVELSELYDLWRAPPHGVKDGLMPVLATALILSRRDKIAFYREGSFRAEVTDLDVEYLAKDAGTIRLRWMDISSDARRSLSEMADLARKFGGGGASAHSEPIDVARGLVAICEGLPPWTKRTHELSRNAIAVRNLFMRASDPNKLLFNDIPAVGGDGTESVREGLEELVGAYPRMLNRIRDRMLTEIRVPNLSASSLAELRSRAENIRKIAGDFRLEAFIGRISRLDDTLGAFEGVAGLAANKPPRDWIDPDVDRATMEIADMAQKFLRAETFARVKNRPDKRQAMAVVIGIGGTPTPIHEEFDMADADIDAVNALVERMADALNHGQSPKKDLVLPALAELTARHIRGEIKPKIKEAAS